MAEKKLIVSYRDLDVYRNSYAAVLRIFNEILPKLPASERYDLKDQISRSSKAVPRLIAEGYAKRHQKMGFQKYLDDAMAECNETVVSLSQCRDLYGIQCEDLIDIYDKCGRQLFNLSRSWTKYKTSNHRTTNPNYDTIIGSYPKSTIPDTGIGSQSTNINSHSTKIY